MNTVPTSDEQLRTEVQKRYAKTALQVLGTEQVPIADACCEHDLLYAECYRRHHDEYDRTDCPNRAVTGVSLLRAKLLWHRRWKPRDSRSL